jgi:hypothetical protein
VMAFIHEGSCDCTKSELDLFSVPPTQTSVESGSFVAYHLISSLTDGGPIEFEVSSTGTDYIDYANSYLYVRAKITKSNGTNVADTDKVGPVGKFLHSFFSQVDVTLNGTVITNSTNTYPYRAYIETLRSYGPPAKKSHLTASLFFKDEAGKMDLSDPKAAAADDNKGIAKRASFTSESAEVDMIGRTHSDIFFQERYMLNEVNTRIKLTRSKDALCLMAAEQAYKVQLTAAAFFVRKLKISPFVYLAHAKTVESGMAKYPIRRVICKTFTIPAEYLDVSHEKLLTGQLPTRLIVGCVDDTAFNEDVTKNPFNFKHLSLNEVMVYLDGQQLGIKPLSSNFARGQYISAFTTQFNGTGKSNRDEGNDIDIPDTIALLLGCSDPLARNTSPSSSELGISRSSVVRSPSACSIPVVVERFPS